MATLQIPVRVTPAANTMTVALEGLYYKLSFRFNARANHWYMSIKHNDVVVVSGIKVVSSEDLLSQLAHMQVDSRLPPGTFIVRDVSGADRDPDQDNFGDEVVLLYEET